MRKELRETEIIEKYLQKELSEEEMKEMEEYIKENPDFALKVEWQKISTESISKAKLLSKIKKAQKRYKMTKALKLTALIAGILALAVASYMTYESYSNKGTKKAAKDKLDEGVEAFISKSENVINELDVQKFKIQTDKDTVIAGEDGTTIFIPAGAFETHEKEIDFILQEAIEPADIMKAGLETFSDSNLLETGGMFMTEAYDSKGKIELKDSAELTVDVPQYEMKEGMQLYDGVKNKDGINWINPKPLEVPLLSVDMSELNFYPPRYEKVLEINGLPLDKDYKDSLYFSFPCEKWKQNQGNVPEIVTIKRMEKSHSRLLSDTLTLSEIDSVSVAESLSAQGEMIQFCPQLPPTSIQAIWNDKFNNTNLATKAFEERVKYIHLEGMESILDVYVQNINKPLWYSDSIAMNLAAKNPEKFRSFYKERKGQVSLKTSAKGLNKFYKKQRESLANANQTAFKKIEKKYKGLVEKQNKLKSIIEQEELKKEAMAIKDEFETNLCETVQRLGYPCKFTRKISLRGVRGTVTSTGWKNIDRQVWETTLARESTTITDPKTGKSAPLRYGMASISLSDMDSYDDIKAYLIPKGTSAYIKMDKKDGGFQKSLSEHMSYKLMVTAYKDGQTYMYADSLKWKQNLNVDLDKVDEDEINAVVLFANKEERMEKSLLKNMHVLGKLSDEKNIAEQKLKSIKEIHGKMKPYIFELCGEGDIEMSAANSTVVEDMDPARDFSD